MDKKYLIVGSNFTGDDLAVYESKVAEDYKTVMKYSDAYDNAVRLSNEFNKSQYSNLLKEAQTAYDDTLRIYNYIKAEVVNQQRSSVGVMVDGLKSINPNIWDGIDYSTLSLQGYNDQLKKIDDEINLLQTDYNISKQAGVSPIALSLKLSRINSVKNNKDVILKLKAKYYPESVPKPANNSITPNPNSDSKNNSEILKGKGFDPIIMVGAGAATLVIIGVIAFADFK